MSEYSCGEASPSDAANLVALYEESIGLYDRWTAKSWTAYFGSYTEGEAISLIAKTGKGEILGHLGLLPVCVGGVKALLQAHVFVAQQSRGAGVFDALQAMAYERAAADGCELLLAFSDHRFARVLRRLFGWDNIGSLPFVDKEAVDPNLYTNRIHFDYSDRWYAWRFPRRTAPYILPYRTDDIAREQLWKTRGQRVTAREVGCQVLSCWCPDSYRSDLEVNWGLCMSIFKISSGLAPEFADIGNWYIEIGDSDIRSPLLRQGRAN